MFKETQNPKRKQRLALHQSLDSFPHRKNESKVVCLSCTLHCVVSLLFQLCRLGNGSRKRKINSHPFTLKLLSISIGVNSHVLNSPQIFQNHPKLLTNSKNLLLLHEVVVKRHAASRKNAKRSLAEKVGFSLLLKNESSQLPKNIMHIQENEVAPQTSQIHLQMRSMQQMYFVNNH